MPVFSHPFWSYGFRPFFFGAALTAGLAIPLWLATLAGWLPTAFLYPGREWHVHEMLFGFFPAAMAGFLLTAVPNWTGRPAVHGPLLGALAALWCAGRVALFGAGAVPWFGAIVDAGFLICFAAVLWRELALGVAWGQVPVGWLVTAYALTNMWFHVQAVRSLPTDMAERAAVVLVLGLLALIGGRLAPLFTREFIGRTRAGAPPVVRGFVEQSAFGSLGLAGAAWIAIPESLITGLLCVAAAGIHAARLVGWRGWPTYREPLVFILHVGYAWVVIGLALIGCAAAGWGIAPATAVHAVTAGAIGAMTFAIMTRATLGHTGRPKVVGATTVVMYLLVNVGAALRLVAPTVDATLLGNRLIALTLAGLCWGGAYLLFACVYGVYLFQPSLENDDDD
ncbi:MAG: NnrS family protein [Nitrospiraceae bacterium]